MEKERFVRIAAWKFNKRTRSARRRKHQTVYIGRQWIGLIWAPGDPCRNKRGRITGQHCRPVKRKWLRAKILSSSRVKHVVSHVVSVRPNAKVRIVEKV